MLVKEQVAILCFFAILICVIVLHCVLKKRQKKIESRRRRQMEGKYPTFERMLAEKNMLALTSVGVEL